MVTLKDIAREAGVSVMTVSRVVNQRYQEVSDKNIATSTATYRIPRRAACRPSLPISSP